MTVEEFKKIVSAILGDSRSDAFGLTLLTIGAEMALKDGALMQEFIEFVCNESPGNPENTRQLIEEMATLWLRGERDNGQPV